MTEVSPTPSPSPTPTAPLVVASVPVHNGEVGLAYAAVALSATGGAGPYSWSLAGGSLPPGLSLSSDGTISGSTPTAGGFSVTVKVSDSGASSATAPASITIHPRLKITQQPCVGQCVIGAGCVKCGGFGVVGAAAPPYLYRIVGGAVPPGMRYSGLGVSGPFPAGLYSLSVQVNDSLGAQVTVGANWAIYNPATLVKSGDCMDTTHYPPSCTVRWTYSRGNPTVVPKLVILGYSENCNTFGQCFTPTAPPPAWSVSVQGGVIVMSAHGSGCVTQYVGTVRLALVDTTACATTGQSNEQDLKVDLEYAC